ncbi:hypothetical protein BO226_11130 [Rhodococcus sp. 2G]|uniref:hypothetical protein n=1 Tax=Rhodococcus sp. 2G TaxID=1570939 RepID=UPI000903FA6C|nr:hypothetical protein [Rhodococcus sp. 2G]APE09685.1 hypothetical protein BO226_11130 [Rhodococcus sp. 2G]
MGYAYYVLPDGREAGYGVEAECDHPGCTTRIDRGLGYLCGEAPDGHRDPDEPGCGKYYCGQHQYAHECTNPVCDAYSDDDEQLCCGLARGHELPHRDQMKEQDFG